MKKKGGVGLGFDGVGLGSSEIFAVPSKKKNFLFGFCWFSFFLFRKLMDLHLRPPVQFFGLLKCQPDELKMNLKVLQDAVSWMFF